MTKHNITLDGSFAVTKGSRMEDWQAVCAVDLAALPAALITDLLLHGLKQKIADAASGAKTEAEAQGSMDKARDAIMAGEWSSRGSGESLDPFTREARKLVRAAYKAKVGAKSATWAEFTGLDDATQAERLDAMFAKNETAMRPAVEAELERLKAERERKAALASDFNI